MEYTHDEYCDMLLTLHACNGQTGTDPLEYALRYPGPRLPYADVYNTWSNVIFDTRSVSRQL